MIMIIMIMMMIMIIMIITIMIMKKDFKRKKMPKSNYICPIIIVQFCIQNTMKIWRLISDCHSTKK